MQELFNSSQNSPNLLKCMNWKTIVSDEVLLRLIMEAYQKTLDTHSEATEALQSLSHGCYLQKEAIKHFQIGYADGKLLESASVPCQLKEQLQQIGILDENGEERFQEAIVVPVLDEQGNVVQIHSRKVARHLPPGVERNVSLKLYDCTVWNHAGLLNQSVWILCSSIWGRVSSPHYCGELL